jgi:NAD(P)-dependent dehydrogenase (short-subunit alcohol dehydrogenase family)
MTTIALITGANKGIGYETARLLGGHGVTVLLGARDHAAGQDAAKRLAEAGIEARHIPLDVTDDTQVRAAADTIAAEFGHLDILVNNAGIARADGQGQPSLTTLPTMREVMETNVYGVISVTNAMLPLLRKAEAARIVNVSSEVGSITSVTSPDSPLYAFASLPYPVSKTALNMVTVMYAKELADTPIKVNAANPGYCATDLNGHHGSRTAEQGAEVSVRLALLGPDGPSGQLWGSLWVSGSESNGVLAW